MSISHDKYKPPTCIPIRMEDIEYTGETPYYIGVRPKELAIYPWPRVTVNTTEKSNTCQLIHTLSYGVVNFGYDPTVHDKNSTYIINCSRDPADDEDPDDNAAPVPECERLVDYGGAEVKKGHLFATVRNFVEPETAGPDDEEIAIPIALQSSVRKINDWRLSTEEKELQDKIIIEIGLLEAIQVNVNATLAKSNIYGYVGVLVENSVLHESLIESDNIVHISGYSQVQSDITAPYVFLDNFTVFEGEGNTIDVSRWLYIKNSTNFGLVTQENAGEETISLERKDFIGANPVYGINNIESEAP